jgi:drug/metabolite transporter (DMT)-like permease
MSEHLQKALRDRDLISSLVSGVVAALCMSFAASATSPGAFQLVLALVAVGATVSAYLWVARSKVDPPWKAAAVVAVGVVGVLCLILLSKVL